MATTEQSRALARSISKVATGAGTPTTALLTDMNESLASSAGNAIEVREAIDFLTGEARSCRLKVVTMALCSEVLQTSGLANSEDDALKKIETALDSGQAAERFEKMVCALGGPRDLLDRPDAYLSPAPVTREVFPQGAGFVTSVNTRELGMAVVKLGGGRSNPEQTIDPRVGLGQIAGLGTRVDEKTPLALIHAGSEGSALRTADEVQAAFSIGARAPNLSPVVHERVVST